MVTVEAVGRRTTADVVFDTLHEEILSLKLLPGTKLSEADVARRIGVSRQPVRDAFSRLSSMDLLWIRPQKATVVRGFRMAQIDHARFVRLALELEVIREACAVWDDARAERLERNLDAQEAAIKAQQTDRFHALDQEFHEEICAMAGCPMAVETIREGKRIVDRLCTLSLERSSEAATLLADHRRLSRALAAGDVDGATAVIRQHLSRLDETIAQTQRTHAEYFE